MSAPATGDYKREISFASDSRERVFDALTGLEGLAGWWTPLVSGAPAAGGQLEFGFAGLEEKIVMRVDEATRPSKVTWTCLTHTGHPEWEGTVITFELTTDGDARALLKFRHEGLRPGLSCYQTCEAGWEHFLASLLNYAQHGNGSPF